MIFAIAYWKILAIIRRQAKVAADETRRDNQVSNEVGPGGFGGRNRSKTLSRAHINVVETMVYVIVCFTVCWMPLYFNVIFKRLTVRKTTSSVIVGILSGNSTVTTLDRSSRLSDRIECPL